MNILTDLQAWVALHTTLVSVLVIVLPGVVAMDHALAASSVAKSNSTLQWLLGALASGASWLQAALTPATAAPQAAVPQAVSAPVTPPTAGV